MSTTIGPQDPGSGNVLPCRPLPRLFTKELSRRVKHVSFSSNPSRMRFYTQEIVLFREDLMRKVRRHALSSSIDGTSDINEVLVETIIKQVSIAFNGGDSENVNLLLDSGSFMPPSAACPARLLGS